MDTKPGIKTSEFWLALIATALVAAGATFSESPWAKIGGAVGGALIVAGYSLSRGMAKAAAEKPPPS